MIKKYQNKEWLYKKYWDEELSIYQIADIYKMSYGDIYYWFKKHNILIRSHSEANHLARGNHCNLSQEAIEWIQGELLGDGCLCSRYINSASFVYGSKYLEYCQYISDTLKSFGIKQVGKINKSCNKRWGREESYKYCSHTYSELLPIYKKWYPEGKKIIPKDMKLTPMTCRQWYIGDGNLAHYKNITRRPRISLATCGFSISGVEWLIKQLIELGFKATRWPAHNIIGISAYSTKQFLDYIGNSPVSCYDYKFNYKEA